MHNPSPLLRRLTVLTLLVISLSACGQTEKVDDGELSIVVTTTILGDVVRNIVGDVGSVKILMPIGVDPHDFAPSSQQIVQIHEADLVIAIGAGLEEGLLDTLAAAETDGVTVIYLATQVAAGTSDPHIWLDATLMAEGGSHIAEALAQIDDTTDWVARGDAYEAIVLEADADVRSILSSIATSNRHLVTNHDSLGFFALAYDFTIDATVFPGLTTSAEPSSADLAELVNKLEQSGTPAIFAETTENSSLASAVASELDGTVQVVELFTGSLGGPGSGAETYIDLLITNAQLIADALGS